MRDLHALLQIWVKLPKEIDSYIPLLKTLFRKCLNLSQNDLLVDSNLEIHECGHLVSL